MSTSARMATPQPVPAPGGPFAAPRFLGAGTAAALALVVAFRALYLARFGRDPCWMNYNFLFDAKAMRFGYPAEFYGMPLIRSALFAARNAGASAAVALGVLYALGHLLLALGVLALGRSVLGSTPRMRAALALASAFALAAAASSCRPESALSVGALAVALAVLGQRLGSGRAGALAAASGLAAGLLAVRLYDRV